MAGTLVLVRHGESLGNLENTFTGWLDPGLTDRGHEEARLAARTLRLRGIAPTCCYTSTLLRARQTLDSMLDALGLADVPAVHHPALNERNYGELTGLNRDVARSKWGEAQVQAWRRSYDQAPPGGESLADTAVRTVTYYEANIEPKVTGGETVLIVAHGNSLRTLVMHMEGLSPEAIVSRELATGEVLVYGTTRE